MALKEVAICAVSKPRITQMKEGDIIVVRNPLGIIGKKEKNDFIWLLMEEEDIPGGATDEGDRIDDDSIEVRKRRHRIDLDDLKEDNTHIDLDRIRDKDDNYQPFFLVDPRDGRVLGSPTVQTRGNGLILDKKVSGNRGRRSR